MKAHISVSADSGRGTSGNVPDVLVANSLLHDQVTNAFGDAGYPGVDKRPDANVRVRRHVAMQAGLRRALDKIRPIDDRAQQREKKSMPASVPGAQAAIWLCESALSGIEEKHGTAFLNRYVVRLAGWHVYFLKKTLSIRAGREEEI